MPVKVNSEDGAARNSGEGSQEFNDFLVAKVMQKERGEDEIKAARGERQMEGIARDPDGISGGEVERALIETDHARIGV
jgi:hypothetical protein